MARARKVFQFLMTLVLSSPIPLSATKEKGSIDQIGHRHVARRSIMSEGMETWLGKWAASRVERSGRFAQDGELNEYVDRLGNKVASHSDLKIHVRTKIIDSSEFDSFSLPGGHLYVTTGLLQTVENEGELAAVLSHEIAHLAARHGANHTTKRLAMLGTGFLPFGTTYLIASWAWQPFTPIALARFSRGQELEADFLGVQYLYNSGYDPESFVSLLQKIRELEQDPKNKAARGRRAYAKYPRSEERIERVKKEIREILPKRTYRIALNSEFANLRNRLLNGTSTLEASSKPAVAAETNRSQGGYSAEPSSQQPGAMKAPEAGPESPIEFTAPVLQHND